MEKPEHHILVCASFRAKGEPQGVCYQKGAMDHVAYIENEIIDRGMDGVVVSTTGCLKACDRGPIMVVYPENLWYGGVESEDIIDEILDGIEDGAPVEKYLIC